jgi:hypothetical protein
VCVFFLCPSIIIIVFMSPHIKSYALGIYGCFKAFCALFINWLQSPVGTHYKFYIHRTMHCDIFL